MSEQGEQEKWGEQAEREAAARLAKAVEKLPPELRAQGAALLAACKGDFKLWSYTVAVTTLSNGVKKFYPERPEIFVDLLQETLNFYRLAVICEGLEFWLGMAKEIREEGEDVASTLLPLMLRAGQESKAMLTTAGKRLQTLGEL